MIRRLLRRWLRIRDTRVVRLDPSIECIDQNAADALLERHWRRAVKDNETRRKLRVVK